MSDIIHRLNTKADMLTMGERIAWGSDSAIMREAAAVIEAERARAERDEQAYLIDIEKAHETTMDYLERAEAAEACAENALSTLKSIAANACCDGCQEAARVARAALSAMAVRSESSQKDAESPAKPTTGE